MIRKRCHTQATNAGVLCMKRGGEPASGFLWMTRGPVLASLIHKACWKSAFPRVDPFLTPTLDLFISRHHALLITETTQQVSESGLWFSCFALPVWCLQ